MVAFTCFVTELGEINSGVTPRVIGFVVYIVGCIVVVLFRNESSVGGSEEICDSEETARFP